MDPALAQAMKNMTPEQAKQMMEQMTPEQKKQMQKMQQGMLDLKHLTEELKPDAEDPDAPVSLLKVVRTLASAPLLAQLPEDEEEREMAEKALAECSDEVLEKLQAAIVAAKSFASSELADCEPVERRNTLLLFYHMYHQHPDFAELRAALPGGTDAMRSYINNLATKLLVKAQMLMPQNRWVQPTLAIAHASALISTALWSHTEEKALSSMTTILREDGLEYPKLSLAARAGPQGTSGEGDEVAAGQNVLVTVSLTRLHAKKPGVGEAPAAANNPQGIYEAYWLYIEGVKPKGTPNSLICAQPMVVKDVEQAVVSAQAPFTAPPTPGTYTLRVHVVSTSVVGVEHTIDTSFTVVEDDVPALE